MMRAASILCIGPWLGFAGFLALTACSSAPSDPHAALPAFTQSVDALAAPPAPKPLAPVKTPCPPVQDWSAADLKALAAELVPVPADSLTMRMALDWRRYRGDAQACAAAQKAGAP